MSTWGQPDYVEIPVIDGVTIPTGYAGISSIIRTYKYEKVVVYVETTDNCTIYLKGGIRDDMMCNLKSGDYGVGSGAQDVDLSWACNNEKIMFVLNSVPKLLQFVVSNGGSGGSITKLAISGV